MRTPGSDPLQGEGDFDMALFHGLGFGVGLSGLGPEGVEVFVRFGHPGDAVADVDAEILALFAREYLVSDAVANPFEADQPAGDPGVVENDRETPAADPSGEVGFADALVNDLSTR